MKEIYSFSICLIILCTIINKCTGVKNIEEEEYGVRFATDCEVCKLVTKEMKLKLQSTDSYDIIQTGYNMDSKKKITKYNKSELRLVETLEEVCNGMSDYRVHKERSDSTRWAKKMSQTFETLHGLVNKGVKVELGIPYELWDEPSAEVSQLKTQCEQFIEDNEDNINNWYFGDQDTTLQLHICPMVLKNKKCLAEPYGEDIKSDTNSETNNKKSKRKSEL